VIVLLYTATSHLIKTTKQPSNPKWWTVIMGGRGMGINKGVTVLCLEHHHLWQAQRHYGWVPASGGVIQALSCNFPLSAHLWHPRPCPFPHSSRLDFFLQSTFYKKTLGLIDLEIFNVNKGLSVMMHILIKRYKSLDSDPLPKHKLRWLSYFSPHKDNPSQMDFLIIPDG
jgi:hypothetical protein